MFLLRSRLLSLLCFTFIDVRYERNEKISLRNFQVPVKFSEFFTLAKLWKFWESHLIAYRRLAIWSSLIGNQRSCISYQSTYVYSYWLVLACRFIDLVTGVISRLFGFIRIQVYRLFDVVLCEAEGSVLPIEIPIWISINAISCSLYQTDLWFPIWPSPYLLRMTHQASQLRKIR